MDHRKSDGDDSKKPPRPSQSKSFNLLKHGGNFSTIPMEGALRRAADAASQAIGRQSWGQNDLTTHIKQLISDDKLNIEELLKLRRQGRDVHRRDIVIALSTIVSNDYGDLEQLGLTFKNSKETFIAHVVEATNHDPSKNTNSRNTALEGMIETAKLLKSLKKELDYIEPSESLHNRMKEEHQNARSEFWEHKDQFDRLNANSFKETLDIIDKVYNSYKPFAEAFASLINHYLCSFGKG